MRSARSARSARGRKRKRTRKRKQASESFDGGGGGGGEHILRPISGTARYSCSKAAGPARHSCETGRCNPRVSFGGRGGDELLEEADGSAITTPTGDRSVKQVSRTPEGRVRSAAAGGAGRGRLSWPPHELSHAGPPMSGAASAASSSSCEVRSRRSSAACCCVSWARCSSSAAGTAPSCSWMAAISRPARPPAGTPKQHVSLG